MIQYKIVDEISLTFSELFIIKKYVKIRFKNRGLPCYFLDVKRSKILQKLNKRDCFCNILGLIFVAFLAQKLICTVNIYLILCLTHFFEQDHLLNLLIFGVYAQRWPKCAHIQNRNWRQFHTKEFKWKEKRSAGLVSETTEALYAELRVYSVFVAKNHQKIGLTCLVHEFSFTDIFLNFVLYGCGFLLLLWKGGQSDVHCNCIVPP